MAEHNKEMRDLIESWEHEISNSEIQFQAEKQHFDELSMEKSDVFSFHRTIVALRKKNDALQWAIVQNENNLSPDLRDQYEVCKNRQRKVRGLLVELEDTARHLLTVITEVQRKQGRREIASPLSAVAQSSAQPLRVAGGVPIENSMQPRDRGYISSQDDNGYMSQLLGPLVPPSLPVASSIPFFQIPLVPHPVYTEINRHRDAISNIIEDTSKTPWEKYQCLCALINPVTDLVSQYQSTANPAVEMELGSLMDHLTLQIDTFKLQSGVSQAFRH